MKDWKTIVFVLVIVAIGFAFVFGWFHVNEKLEASKKNDSDKVNAFREIGEAETLDDLPPKCRKNAENWMKWVRGRRDEEAKKTFDLILSKASKNGISFSEELKGNAVWYYNNGYNSCY